MSKRFRESKLPLEKVDEFTAIDCSGDKGFTVQADRDDADINKILKRIQSGGTLGRVNSKEPFFGDVSEFDGLADAIMKVNKANDLFSEYKAEVRERFDNDPVKFVEFFEDPNNLDEAIKLGLALPKVEVKPQDVPGTPAPGA